MSEKTRTVVVRRWDWAPARIDYVARSFEVPADLPEDEVIGWVQDNADHGWDVEREEVSDNIDETDYEVVEDPGAEDPEEEDEEDEEDKSDTVE